MCELCLAYRSLVDEADAAVSLLLARKQQGFKRLQVWEVPENAERLGGIGASDRCGVA
jgi:hypothetical protein